MSSSKSETTLLEKASSGSGLPESKFVSKIKDSLKGVSVKLSYGFGDAFDLLALYVTPVTSNAKKSLDIVSTAMKDLNASVEGGTDNLVAIVPQVLKLIVALSSVDSSVVFEGTTKDDLNRNLYAAFTNLVASRCDLSMRQEINTSSSASTLVSLNAQVDKLRKDCTELQSEINDLRNKNLELEKSVASGSTNAAHLSDEIKKIQHSASTPPGYPMGFFPPSAAALPPPPYSPTSTSSSALALEHLSSVYQSEPGGTRQRTAEAQDASDVRNQSQERPDRDEPPPPQRGRTKRRH